MKILRIETSLDPKLFSSPNKKTIMKGAYNLIHQEVAAWEGITHRPHSFGGTEYDYNGKEIGHIHGDAIVDILFSVAIRKELVETGKASAHHILPETGWVTVYLRTEEEVKNAIELLRYSYELKKKKTETLNH
jgi:hypothetical protein